VTITRAEIRVSDDGAGPPTTPTGAGHGLAGLHDRVAAQGGSVRIGRSTEGGFELAVRV
jgi:signal transduction histidine kinase